MTTKTYPENEYGRYCIPEGLEQRPAAKAVLSGRPYEPDTIRFMRQNCGQGDIVHAGTFFGDFLPGLSKGMARDAKVWAFEPNPDNFAAACQTIQLNNLSNVELTNAGVSNQPGEILFKTKNDQGRSLGGLSHFVTEHGPGVEAVQSAMIDYAVPRERHVSIIQFDVEGHEVQALLGSFHTIHRCKPILILEYFEKMSWLTRQFRGLGYERIGKLHGNTVFAVQGAGITI
ncbi:FkbM family methyltransferase [Sagittula sp. SSi028]|uniref:FkbM family methyltransferase n=1 Tax=Sagittula sp. SSi028 TaxID=3400636 RepID=UPI003AF99E8D